MSSTTNVLFALGAAGFALGAAGQSRDPVPIEQSQSIVTAAAPAAGNKTAEDVEFLLDAMRTALAEVQLGELAAQRGGTAAVREYGAKLEADHTEQAAEIERLLRTMNVTVPTEPSAEALTHHVALERLTGEEFDAAFLTMMTESHEEAIEKFSAQTHANPDQALADFASKSLPTLREHLATAQSLQ